MKPKIFVSMGTPYKIEQEEFRNNLETFLREECNADPRIIGKNEYPDANPLEKILNVMKECNGVIVVAYERKLLQSGIEKRGSNIPDSPNEKVLQNLRYTTPWNHIESAMAFALGIPLYILCDEGVVEEALIETKMDWYVQRVKFNEETFKSPSVRSSVQSWVKGRVSHYQLPRSKSYLSGKIKLSEMTPAELFGAFTAVATVFGAGFGIGNFFAN